MTFIHFSLLTIGGLCVAIPVVIHLMMRRRPRHQVFPALRFVKERRLVNQRRMRLRHLCLLALRCAAIATFALALARPTVAAAAVGDWGIFAAIAAFGLFLAILAIVAWRNESGRLTVISLGTLATMLAVVCVYLFARFQSQGAGAMLGSQEAPVSAILLFDTSPRMLYREGNHTRLELAQDHARWLLTQLPDDSEVAVVETSVGPMAFALDRSIAAQSIDTLEISHNSQRLPDVLDRCRNLLKTARHSRHEIYVLSELSAASWRTELHPDATHLPDDNSILLHILDVGSLTPRNTQLTDLILSQEWLSHGGTARLQTNLAAAGSGGEWAVELMLETQDPRRPIIVDGKPLMPDLKLRGQLTLQVEQGSSQPIDFQLARLDPGTHHGLIRLRGHDGLDIDNTRYFTVEVSDPWPVLLVAGPEAVTEYLSDALAPLRMRETSQARFRCDVADYEQLSRIDLSGYRAVALLDPTPLTQRQWRQLSGFVEPGGGLAIFLGRNVSDIRQFSTVATETLLPAAPRRHWNAPAGSQVYLTLRDTSHPMLSFFQPFKDSLSWNQFPIYRHWSLGPLSKESMVIMRFSNDQPAIVERMVGTGRVLMMTTPVSDPMNIPDRPAWNYLPTDMDPTFFMLVNEVFEYLAGGSQDKLNYFVGEPVSIAVPDAKATDRFQLFTPNASWQGVSPQDGQITTTFTEPIGAYRLRAESSTERPRGFSVNIPAKETDLERVADDYLDQLLGKGRYHRSRDRTEINREIVEARIGRELYPWLIIMTVVLLITEYVLSNRFYRETTT